MDVVYGKKESAVVYAWYLVEPDPPELEIQGQVFSLSVP